MNFTFENQGTSTYLVYEIGAGDVVDTMALGMLTHNKIVGLAPVQFTQVDDKKYIKYNISARVSVQQFFEGAVNRKRLVGVCKGIVNAMLSAEEYMIDPSSIIMDINYMYADVSSCETTLVCLPLANVPKSVESLGLFFKNLVFQTQFDQTENCEYIARILNFLNSPSLFSLVDFQRLLNDLDQGPQQPQPKIEQQPQSQPQAQPQPRVEPQPQPQPKIIAPQVNVEPKPQPQILSTSAGGTGGGAPFVVPPAKAAEVRRPDEGQGAVNQGKQDEEKISLWYLMNHYNKENAAAYKAQKEAKKRAAAEGKTKMKPEAKKKEKDKQPVTPVGNFGFAVPNQPAPTGVPSVPQTKESVPSQSVHVPPVPAPQPTYMPPTQTPQPSYAPPTQTPQPPYVPPMVTTRQNVSFGETTVLNGGTAGETTVLAAAQALTQAVNPYLIRKKNNEKISLNKPVFRIGKERSYVDYFIGDNTAISRSHANFISRDGQFLVVDTNSTNHTFVNGAMIQSNQEVPIAHGDVVRLANEDFEFHLY